MCSGNDIQRGFTLIEMIVVIVITGIIAGAVAIFLRTPIQGYMDSARRAEMTDIADTALRRIGRDLRTAVPNSVRVPNPSGTNSHIEFLPTRDGGRYRADAVGGADGCATVAGNVNGDALSFAAADTCFEIIGPALMFAAGDQIVVGSTQSDGNPPYQDPTAAACGVATTTTCIRRPVPPAGAGTLQTVVMTSAYAFPAFAELPGQRFDVVPANQQAVTYWCDNPGTDSNGDGTGTIRRYWAYGFNAAQVAPPLGGSSAILANNVSDCNIVYDTYNVRSGLVQITLAITRDNETVSLYHQIHVNNIP